MHYQLFGICLAKKLRVEMQPVFEEAKVNQYSFSAEKRVENEIDLNINNLAEDARLVLLVNGTTGCYQGHEVSFRPGIHAGFPAY
ncbi:MAG: hypothetical protein IKT57_09660 [Clostridia bacterium]|nr:hypothetical protein [Clostridia bacterium]